MGIAENNQLGAASGVLPGNLPHVGREQRREPRYMANWRVAVSTEGHSLTYGRLKDISRHGAGVLCELNLKPNTRITLSIYVPTLDRACESRVLTIRSVAAYTIYDADRQCFRIGVTFTEFAQPSDCAYLEDRLMNYHVQVPDYVCQRSTDA